MAKHKYTDEQIAAAVPVSTSIMAVLRQLNAPLGGSQHAHITMRVKRLGLDVSHFKQYCTGPRLNRRKHWSEKLILREGKDTRQSGTTLRRALLESGRPYLCEKCGLAGEWEHEPIVLEVDHVDGNWLDDRPENLAFLCPNCHSQKKKVRKKAPSRKSRQRLRQKSVTGVTASPPNKLCAKCGIVVKKKSTHCSQCNGKEMRRCERPNAEELKVLLWTQPTSVIAKRFNVSDTAIAKWAKADGIVKPPRGYWAKQKSIGPLVQ